MRASSAGRWAGAHRACLSLASMMAGGMVGISRQKHQYGEAENEGKTHLCITNIFTLTFSLRRLRSAPHGIFSSNKSTLKISTANEIL